MIFIRLREHAFLLFLLLAVTASVSYMTADNKVPQSQQRSSFKDTSRGGSTALVGKPVRELKNADHPKALAEKQAAADKKLANDKFAMGIFFGLGLFVLRVLS